MNDKQLTARNAAMLAQLDERFRVRIKRVMQLMVGLGERPRIQCAWRSEAEQLEAFTAGKSKVRWGFHCASRDGGPAALAADILDDRNPLAPPKSYMLRLAWAASNSICQTGIEWGLPAGLASATRAAYIGEHFGADVRVGWDPCHVEPADLTIAEARSGILLPEF